MAEQTRLRVGQNGRMVIPALRKAEGVILLRIGDNELRITTQQRRIRRARAGLGAICNQGPRWSRSCFRGGARRPGMSRIVLDASPILALIHQEPGHEKLPPQLLADAVASAVNLAEVYSKLVSSGWSSQEAWEHGTSPVQEVVSF